MAGVFGAECMPGLVLLVTETLELCRLTSPMDVDGVARPSYPSAGERHGDGVVGEWALSEQVEADGDRV